MPKIRRKSIENDFLLIFFLHAERGCRSIIYFNDFATPSFFAPFGGSGIRIAEVKYCGEIFPILVIDVNRNLVYD